MTVVRTQDGGKNWRRVYARPDSNHFILSIFFFDEQTGVMSSNHGEIYGSRDGGESWTLKVKTDRKVGMFGAFHPAGLAFFVSGSGCFFRSDNRGETFREIPFDRDLDWVTGVTFVDSRKGWLYNSRLASGTLSDASSVFRTTDGGHTWTRRSDLPAIHLGTVLFTDTSTGWTAGGDRIYHTPDGGKTWSLQPVLPPGEERIVLRRLRSADGHVWALGWGGEVLKYSPDF